MVLKRPGEQELCFSATCQSLLHLAQQFVNTTIAYNLETEPT